MIFRHVCATIKSCLKLSRFRWIGVASLLLNVAAHAEEPSKSGPTAAGLSVTSIAQYWRLSPEQKAKPVEFRFECDVTYFDPMWRILFVQDAEGFGAYVPYGGNNFPFKAGERILATGIFIPPNADISFEHAVLTEKGPARTVPVPAVSLVTRVSELVNRLVVLEGFVDSYRLSGTDHLEINLSVEGQCVVLRVPFSAGQSMPNLADATVRVTGVYNPKLGPDGQFYSLEIMVPDLNSLTILSRLSDDPRFKQPIEPIAKLGALSRTDLVRIVGQVKAQELGRYLRLRDNSGQIDIITGQTRPCAIDEWIEAVGYPEINGTDWKLIGGLYRVAGSSSTTVLPPTGNDLRLAASVLELSPAEAARSHPVWLRGVVTWSHPDSPFFFMQDSSGGVCVLRGNSISSVRGPGRQVEVRGYTAMGSFAPVVAASRFDKLSEMVLPLARQISLEQALTGMEEAQWVEMRGYLRKIRREGGWNTLEVATPTGEFLAELPAAENASSLVGAVVRIHGVCTAITNERRKLTGIKLWVSSAANVQVVEAAPVNPFDVPLYPLGSLGQFSALQAFNHRARVSGVVLYHSPGHLIHIADGAESLLVYARDTTLLRPGDRIEAVGFVGRQRGRVTLREAIYRKTGFGAEPAPQPLDSLESTNQELDGRLVRIEGTLIEASSVGDQTRLTMQTGRVIFEGKLDNVSTDWSALHLTAGSQLALVGVYEVKYDEYGQPAGFQLQMRTPADLQVLQSPSWLTRERVLGVAAALVLAVVLCIGWVTALRRRVGKQTQQILKQVQREARLEAELQRAGKLESLGLLAGGLAHDFNNLLTVVMGNLSLARLDTRLAPDTATSIRDAEKASVRARDLTQQLLTFAKGGAPIFAAVSLPDVVREVAEFVLHGSNVRCEFAIPAALWAANVDKGQIGQVVQNIVLNGIQAMSDGGVIDISLANSVVAEEMAQILSPGRYVLLTVTDHGKGISPSDLGKIFDPYFTTKKRGNGLGLATVYSIVKKHHGHITAESVQDCGTTFRIWLPAAGCDAAKRKSSHSSPALVPAAAGQARVLFMDDEESIRRLGASILQRMGHEVAAVPDGAEAVRKYSEARSHGRAFDLVIFDLTIPGGLGGRAALEQILREDPQARAIVSSGYSNDQVLSNYRAHGFHGMILKPYVISDFTQVVEKVLRGERM
jgi:two-component system, cell cycle sensor histidine kinase and response regulator CckA